MVTWRLTFLFVCSLRARYLFLVAGVLLVPAVTVLSAETLRTQVKAVYVTHAPQIDGRLDNQAWEGATPITEFRRTEDRNLPPSEQTQAWMVYNQHALYVAFSCSQRPETIYAQQRRRGGEQSLDDHVEVWLDPLLTARWVYRFQINAIGTKTDDIPGGAASKPEWRGDWQGAVMRTEEGWTAEIAIPFSMLRYPAGTQQMGLILQRYIAAEHQKLAWPPEVGASVDLQRMAVIHGLQLDKRAAKILTMPYAVVSLAENHRRAYGGLDVKKSFSNGMLANLSINPDFENVERSVGSADFSYTGTLIPETRPFFADGAGFMPSSLVFHTQSIQQTDVGGKLYGRVGRYTLGMLGTTARGGSHAYAIHVGRNLGARANLYLDMVASRGLVGENIVWSAGADRTWQPSEGKFVLRGRFYRTSLSDVGQGSAYFIGVERNWSVPGRLSWSLNYTDFSPLFRAVLGFVPEVNFRKLSAGINYWNKVEQRRIQRWEMSLFALQSWNHSGDGAGQLHDRALYPNVWVDLSNRWTFNVGYSFYERPPFRDRFANISMGWNAFKPDQAGSVSCNWGRRADADYRYLALDQNLRVSGRLGFSMHVERLFMRFADSRVTRLQAISKFTYEIAADQTISFRWLFDIGSSRKDESPLNVYNLYIAYQRSVHRGSDFYILVGSPSSRTITPQLVAKLFYVIGGR